MSPSIKLIECPRDALQGWKTLVPTAKKIEYLQALLEVGFNTLDCGSFVSPKAIPQMADTREVLRALSPSNTKLLVIVANQRGAEEAMAFDQVKYLGFPFSVSETFQQRNTNSTIAASLERVEAIQQLCIQHSKELVVYISMGFGNPYGDPYSENIVFEWADKLAALGVKTISLADTVGVAQPEQVQRMTKKLVTSLPDVEIGVHLHSSATNRIAKLSAAIDAGCLRFDGALKGIGGCPMANDELVGNMDSAWMISYFKEHKYKIGLDEEALKRALVLADEIFT